MRVRYNKNLIEKLQKSRFLVKNFPIKIDKNWKLEIGMGKGEMLTEMAKKNKDTYFLGIEKNKTIAGKSLLRAQEYNLLNFYILTGDIKEIYLQVSGKCSCIYLTFPDPWPKDRHGHRRLTATPFLNIYKKLLFENGKLILKTDNEKLFDFSVNQLIKNNWKIINQSKNLHHSNLSQGNVFTGYETKFAKLNQAIFYFEAQWNQ